MTYVSAVRDALATVGDPERALQQQAYMKSALPFVGLGAPALRALLRPLLSAHTYDDRTAWEAAARELWDGASHREEWYAALALLRHRPYRAWLDPGLLPLLEHLVVTGAWWDVVDEIASHLVGEVLARHRAVVTPVMVQWAGADDLWMRRVAILCQLGDHEATDTALLGRVIATNLEGSRHGSQFFVRKAVGWALRDYARTDPTWVRAFVAHHAERLSPLSRREALKHLG